jgi:hypothetical protein
MFKQNYTIKTKLSLEECIGKVQKILHDTKKDMEYYEASIIRDDNLLWYNGEVTESVFKLEPVMGGRRFAPVVIIGEMGKVVHLTEIQISIKIGKWFAATKLLSIIAFLVIPIALVSSSDKVPIEFLYLLAIPIIIVGFALFSYRKEYVRSIKVFKSLFQAEEIKS